METVELMDPPGALLDKSRASSESMKPSNFTHVKPVKYIYIYLWIYMYQVKFSGQTSDIRTFGQPDRNSICIYIYMYYMFIHLNYIYIFTFIYIYIYIYWQLDIMINRYVYRLRQTACMHCKPFGCHGILQRERESVPFAIGRKWHDLAMSLQSLEANIATSNIKHNRNNMLMFDTFLCVVPQPVCFSLFWATKVYTNGFLEQRWTAFGRDTVPEIGSWSCTADSSLNTRRLHLCV